MQHGTLAGYPVKDVRVRLYDGQHHSVDSSEMAFKIAGSMAFKQAMEQADPVLLEPIMLLTVSVPEDVVGDVVGDLNSRRGRPLGMEAKGSATEIKAEVPMAEVLDYARDLRADHRRSRRLHDGIRSPRGDPLAPGPEGDLGGSRRGGGPGLTVAAGSLPHVAKRVIVNVDGGSRGNPGPAAIAAVVTDPSGASWPSARRRSARRPTTWPSTARCCSASISPSELGADEVEFVGDSMLIVEQVRGRWKVKQAHLRPLHAEVRDALRDLGNWSIRHVKRGENERADELLNDALDGARRLRR